jgi:hypothetical protein
MRARMATVLTLLIASLLFPQVPMASAQLEELGHAGRVTELEGSALGWWTMEDGNVLYASVQGDVIEYSVTDDIYTEVWSKSINKTLLSSAYNSEEKLIAFGTDTGAIVVSIEYRDVLYSVLVGQDVDGLTWDADGDLWLTKRTSKHAIEATGSTPTGESTSNHNNGITDVIALSDGRIITTGRDKFIRIHDENGTYLDTLTDSNFILLRLGVSADGNWLFSMSDNCRLNVHNTTSWVRGTELNLCSNGQGRSIQQLGDRLMIGMTNGKAFSIDMTDFSKDQTFSVPGEVVGFRSADGNGILMLTAFSQTSEVHLLDADRDDDGVVDGFDDFPDDSTQDTDTDGDGWGDDSDGNNADAFPNEETQWSDRDGDLHGDNPNGNSPDAFPDNADQQTDSDGDGYGDNRYGLDGDKFVYDPTQWVDFDYDGYGDNQEPGATSPDACPLQNGNSLYDRLGCQDSDGDGWSDPDSDEMAHPFGSADTFPAQVDQWRDTDGDGYGDNLTGHRGDACPAAAGTSTRAVMYDPGQNRYSWIYRYGCLDSDGDGFDDNTESTYNDGCTMVGNRTEWLDHDRDCAGSNGDYNDTDPEVQTLADHCEKHPDDFSACEEAYDPNANIDNLTKPAESDADTMGMVKDFAIWALVIVGGMGAALFLLVGSIKMIGAAAAKRKPDAQYTHQDATRELDAWESGDSFQTRGGIDDQKGWEDEPVGEGEDSADLDDLFAMAEELADDSTAGEMIDPDTATEEIADVATPADTPASPDPEPESASETPSAPETESAAPGQIAPDEAPELPPGGLPEGWTTEQWRWYGHQWLESQGEN